MEQKRPLLTPNFILVTLLITGILLLCEKPFINLGLYLRPDLPSFTQISLTWIIVIAINLIVVAGIVKAISNFRSRK